MLKNVLLYIMAAFYSVLGFLHLIEPDLFLYLLPEEIPYKIYAISISGTLEILLGFTLLDITTRNLGLRIVQGLLVVYLLIILIPLTISLYHKGSSYFLLSLFAIPFQFILIFWAGWHKLPVDHDHSDSLV